MTTYTDGITALPNRAAIDHLLQYALNGPKAGQFRAALLFIDLDGFKRVNDTLGHDGGDILLRLASRRILEQGLGRDLFDDLHRQRVADQPRAVVFEQRPVLRGLEDRAVVDHRRGMRNGQRRRRLRHVDLGGSGQRLATGQ